VKEHSTGQPFQSGKSFCAGEDPSHDNDDSNRAKQEKEIASNLQNTFHDTPPFQ
jgi:hypothetical protein